MGVLLPITSKLLPRSSNLMYLAEVAVLTRLATGVMRVLENSPSKQKDPSLTEGQKKQAMTERFFVEILGTMGYMACLHLGQDLVDKLANCRDRALKLSSENLLHGIEGKEFNDAKKLLETLGEKVGSLDHKLRASVSETYGEHFKNPIFHTLYEHELPVSTKQNPVRGKANLATVKNQLKKKMTEEQLKNPQLDDALSKIVNEVKPLKDFAMKNNKLAVMGIAAGVAASAVVGGSLTQWMNDRVIAPGAKKFFARKAEKKALASPVSLAAGPNNNTVPKSISLLSAAPPLPLSATQPTPIAPVYLPNPKTRQASAPIFAARPLVPAVNKANTLPWSGGGL